MNPNSWHRDPVRLTLLPCFLFTAILAIISDGCYHDDDLTHFLMARWSRWYPGYLLHIWGRPGLTIPLAAVSWLNDGQLAWRAARLLSCIATAAGALIAARLAAQWGFRQAWLVVIACYLQPLSSILAYTSLTENWVALYLIAAVALLEKGRPLLASVLFSLSLVTRHECAIFIPFWWLALYCSAFRIPHSAFTQSPTRSLQSAILPALTVLWAPLLHNVLFRIAFNAWPAKIFAAPKGSTEFLPTGPLAYIPNLIQAVTPFLIGLAVIGGVMLLRQRQWLVVAIPAVFFICQAVIKAVGLYASGGYSRFMVSVSPFIAILAAAGFQQIWTGSARWHWHILAGTWLASAAAIEIERRAGRIDLASPYPIRTLIIIVGLTLFAVCIFASARRNQNSNRSIAAILALTCLIQCAVMVKPLHLHRSQQDALNAAAWLRDQKLDQGPLFMTHPWLVWDLGLAENPRAHKGPILLASMPVGTIFIWDSGYSPSDFHNLPLERITRDDSYELLKEMPSNDPKGITFRVFRKIKPTPLPPVEKTYPPSLSAEEDPLLGIYYTRIPR